MLTFSAYAAVVAVAVAHYGDGVTRPRLFILADQVPAVLAMVLHTAAVIEMHARWPAGTACGPHSGSWTPGRSGFAVI